MKEKTATHHYGYFANLEHNNRDRISVNIDESRLDNNVYLVTAGAEVKDEDNNIVFDKDTGEVLRYATVEEIYNKVFEPTWQEFQRRQRKCRRTDMTYFDWVQDQYKKGAAKVAGTNKINTAAKPIIELYSQIGNIDDTGWEVDPAEAKKAKKAIEAYHKDFLKRDYVCTVTTKELNDPNWKPPFSNGFIVLNDVIHGDEATTHSQLNVIPYTENNKTGNKRGISLQKVSEGIGYSTELVDALDEQGNKVPYLNKHGEQEYLKDGSLRYLKVKKTKGFTDFLEDERTKLIEYGKEYGWIRKETDISKKSRKHLETNDYVVEKQKEKLENLKEQSSIIRNENKKDIEFNDKLKEEQYALKKEKEDLVMTNELILKRKNKLQEELEEIKDDLDFLKNEQEYLKEYDIAQTFLNRLSELFDDFKRKTTSFNFKAKISEFENELKQCMNNFINSIKKLVVYEDFHAIDEDERLSNKLLLDEQIKNSDDLKLSRNKNKERIHVKNYENER